MKKEKMKKEKMKKEEEKKETESMLAKNLDANKIEKVLELISEVFQKHKMTHIEIDNIISLLKDLQLHIMIENIIFEILGEEYEPDDEHGHWKPSYL